MNAKICVVIGACLWPWLGIGAEHAAEGEYALVWSDEFDREGKPDPSKWVFEYGFVRNQELQWYQPQNAYCEDGRLIIEGRKERVINPRFREGADHGWTNRAYAEYTSACVKTKGLHEWQYGRFEIRAKIRAHEGLWPAIWFLGSKGSWPSCGEIDLMEYYRGDILANVCWAGEKEGRAKWSTTKTPVASFRDPAWDSRFHIWRMDWDENQIQLFVDDQLLNTVDLRRTINTETRGGPSNPFHQPHHILLNLAIGSTGGDPGQVSFPTRYEIDYVRVYQKKK